MYFVFYILCRAYSRKVHNGYLWLLNFRYMLKEDRQFIVDFEERNVQYLYWD